MTKTDIVKQTLKTIEDKINRVQIYVQEFDASLTSINQLKARQQILEAVRKEFEQTQYELESIENKPDDAARHANARIVFEDNYCNIISAIADIIDKVQANPSSSQRAVTIEQSQTGLNLPTLNLVTFTGNYKDWINFENSFDLVINNNTQLSNQQKLHYLKSCLMGDALKSIETLPVKDENYNKAWEILVARFKNTRLIVQNHVMAILNAPSVLKSSHTALRELYHSVTANISTLNSLSIATDQWDALLIPIVVEKLDYITRRDWEASLDTSVPKYCDFIKFLNKRCNILESMNYANHSKLSLSNSSTKSTLSSNKPKTMAHLATSKKQGICAYCKMSGHNINRCEIFINLSDRERNEKAREMKLCLNCLRDNHAVANCRITTKCRICDKKHSTLLHLNEESSSQDNITITNHASNNKQISCVLLSTAIVSIKGNKGKFEKCRALLDQGSMSNYISKAMCKRLGLETKSCNIEIKCLNQVSSTINKYIHVDIKSNYNAYCAKQISCLVVDKITENLPLVTLDSGAFNVPKNIQLADPTFYCSAPIDMLIGAELFFSLLCVGQFALENGLVFQKTHFGFIAGGPVAANNPRKNPVSYTSCNLSTIPPNNKVDNLLVKFFEVESSGTEFLNEDNKMSRENIMVEKHFTDHVLRTKEGRFIVKLPTRQPDLNIGETKSMALKRFYNIERKLQKDSKLKIEYTKFIKEYSSLSHMELISEIPKNHCYLPHHAVLKPEHLTTKLRIVFDASAKGSNQKSLNDNLLGGPVVQRSLFAILLQFRTYLYTLSADIEKMYRQILVSSSDAKYQLILWRDNPSEDLKTFQLNTLTYGTKSASFLATRCLSELAIQNRIKYPKACDIILNNFYMDDMIAGADCMEDLKKLRDEIIIILKQGQFHLRKFQSNNVEILPKDDVNESHLNIRWDKDDHTKILGLYYHPASDTLKYDVNIAETKKVTKRVILSESSKLFDPLGLIGPVTIKAKFIMQQLCSLKLNWDEAVPISVYTAWKQFTNEILLLKNIALPRAVRQVDAKKEVELHAFCDGSEKAYGAAIYIRTKNKSGQYTTTLMCAKNRVTPQKTMTIPRIELCGALLAARLLTTAKASMIGTNISQQILWCDSAIVIAWINNPSKMLKTFVANRIAEITTLTNPKDWRHISSQLNAADILSRGASTEELLQCKSWFAGPQFLLKNEIEWPQSKINIKQENLPETRSPAIICNLSIEIPEFTKFSNYFKLQRVIAWAMRFINNCKTKSKVKNLNNMLSVNELNNATNIIVRTIQISNFSVEWSHLKNNKPLPAGSKIASLSPFFDDNDIIRVGGRVGNSRLSIDAKHPAILPKSHPVTDLIIKQEHERLLHAGPQATLAGLRQRFWIMSGRSSIRKIIHKCLKCFKINPVRAQFLMGNLPAKRVQPARPFITSGCDFAGPILTKESTGRGRRLVKTYIVVFVCFATKAIHIELATALSTEEFLAAFKRFISRRGYVRDIYTDHGSNFLGANNELRNLYDFLKRNKNIIDNQLSDLHMNWHFIPPSSPHMGGLWEAGVKSIKRHLKATVGNACLSIIELYTVLVQIEACLNSRPLTPLTSDPNDFEILTPGHFLIGEPLMAIPEYPLQEVPINRLSRWQLVERIRQHFWTRWSKEYLTSLQQRAKWFMQHRSSSVKLEGALVLLVDDNTQPLLWKIGRIINTHPGKDGHVRVVTVKTKQGFFKRALTKICLLPIEEDNPKGTT